MLKSGQQEDQGQLMPPAPTCPKCGKPVTAPEGVNPAELVRCPLCQAEYPLDVVLLPLPPSLVPVNPRPAAPAPAPPQPAEIFNFATDQQEPHQASELVNLATIARRPSRRKQTGVLRELLKVILGGLFGLLVGYYVLCWFGPEGMNLPKLPLPFLPHTTAQADPDSAPQGEQQP